MLLGAGSAWSPLAELDAGRKGLCSNTDTILTEVIGLVFPSVFHFPFFARTSSIIFTWLFGLVLVFFTSHS